ncbi:MAG: transposase, partial [Chloroflexota bacterium]
PHWVPPTPKVAPAKTAASTANGPKRGSSGAIIGAYKMSVTRRIQSEWNKTTLWQRNYYERIIRNNEEHQRIHLYIEANVEHWEEDEENPG